MLRRTLGVVLVNLIVFCVLAELLALFLFYNDTGRLFYTYQKPYEPIAETQQGRLTGEAAVAEHVTEEILVEEGVR